MASIFTDAYGGLRTQFYEASLAQIAAATSVTPFVLGIMTIQADKFFLQNSTNAVLFVLVTPPQVPNNEGDKIRVTTPQLLVKIQPFTAFNLDNAQPAKISIPAGTTVSIYAGSTPTTGNADLFCWG